MAKDKAQNKPDVSDEELEELALADTPRPRRSIDDEAGGDDAEAADDADGDPDDEAGDDPEAAVEAADEPADAAGPTTALEAMALADAPRPKPMSPIEDTSVPGPARLGRYALLAIPLIIAVLIAALAIDNSDSDELASTSSATSSSSTSSSSSSSTTSSSIAFATATTALDTTTSTAAAASATTVAAALSCRNSTNPSCGAFRWDPSPGNDNGMGIEVSWFPQTPRVGEEVVFNVSVVDPDATPIGQGACGTGGTGIAFGDGPGIATACGAPCASARYGPWTPPARSRGTAAFTYRHVYGAAGQYSPVVVFGSSNPCNPYATTGHLNFSLVVTE